MSNRLHRKHRKFRPLAVALVSMGLIVALASCGRGGAGASGGDPGISDSNIVLGATSAFSGPQSAYAALTKGSQAYFAKINDEGGVKSADGKSRTIELKTSDDAFQRARALANAKQLVQKDGVFALYGTVGTGTTLAVAPYSNANKIPLISAVTGDLSVGDAKANPWVTQAMPSFRIEAEVFAKYLQKVRPNGGKVAMLYQNDDYGQQYKKILETQLGGSGFAFVAEESYAVSDPDVSSQMGTLARSGADTFMDISTSKHSAQAITEAAQLGWRPLHLLNGLSASKKAILEPAGLDNSKGIVSAAYYKDPSDPHWNNDPGANEYRATMAKYQPSADPGDPFYAWGYFNAQMTVAAIKAMKGPTRAALMDAAHHLDNVTVNLLLPGIEINTTADSTTPIGAMQIEQFDGKQWNLMGDPVVVNK